MLPRTAFSTSVTLSWPAAWARSVGASVTCRTNNWTAATTIKIPMTAFPARCRKTNDAPRVPACTSCRVRRSRAECPVATASDRSAGRAFLASLAPLAFRNLFGSRTSWACGCLTRRFGWRTPLASCALRGPRVACDRRVRMESPRLTGVHPVPQRGPAPQAAARAPGRRGRRGQPVEEPRGPSPAAPEQALPRVTVRAPARAAESASRPTGSAPRRAAERARVLPARAAPAPGHPAGAAHRGPPR